MSTESQNVALKGAYQRWHDSKAGSVAHWLSLMTDDVQFRSLAAGVKAMEFTRESCCKNDVIQYFAGLTSEWEMIYYRVDEYIAQGDRVVALCQYRLNTKRRVKLSTRRKPTFINFATARSASFSSSSTRRVP